MLIPLPFVTAALCGLLVVRIAFARLLPVAARWIFGFLFLGGMAESVLVGLRFGYGYEGAIIWQRMLPLFFAPSIFLGFRSMNVTPIWRDCVIHFGIAASLTAALPLLARSVPQAIFALDFVIAGSYVAYWIPLFLQYRKGAECFSLLPIEATERMRLWLLGALILLVCVFAIDCAVAISFMWSAESAVAPLIALGSLPIIAALIIAALSVPSGKARPAATGDSAALDQIAAVLAETHAYRDPELSLAKFARLVGQPVRQISRTVNEATGSSVSNYINGWRIDEAAELLATTGRKIDDIAYAVGFLSRSNFYREFQRRHGISPSVFRKKAKSND